jgi:8-oxo-dGTP pyrophosphatase MutT (NUDIX family)
VKTLSCGILVLNPKSELLLCHATGTFVWDIPKGRCDTGETPLQTAIRETAEECGLRFEPAELLELGRFSYRPAKDLHLYAALVDGIDARDCHCSSHFTDLWGRDRPEMDAFEWTAFERVHRRCARRMGTLLTQTLSLPRVLTLLLPRDAKKALRPR